MQDKVELQQKKNTQKGGMNAKKRFFSSSMT